MLHRGEIKIRNGMPFIAGQTFCVLEPTLGDLFQCYFQLNSVLPGS